jgi:hypothetical protein
VQIFDLGPQRICNGELDAGAGGPSQIGRRRGPEWRPDDIGVEIGELNTRDDSE